ncbi:MAG: hypothetical protein IKH26_13380 [Bacteroidaceae bacterium]|nr:hypothetical protein [Bacteroidaceae bacterium]
MTIIATNRHFMVMEIKKYKKTPAHHLFSPHYSLIPQEMSNFAPQSAERRAGYRHPTITAPFARLRLWRNW